MKAITIYQELSAEDLMGAIINCGGDPVLIEDEESAAEYAEYINGATIRREIKDADEFAAVMSQLDLNEGNRPLHLYSFVNGSEGVVCFAEDWDVAESNPCEIDAYAVAEAMTRRSAEIKTWRLNRKCDREMRDIAISLMRDGGYLVATPSELHDAHPSLFPQDNGPDRDAKIMWAVSAGLTDEYGRVHLNFCPITVDRS